MNNFTEYLKNTGYLDTTNGNDGSVSTTNTWSGDGQSPMNSDSQLSDAMDVANRYDAGKADRAESRRNIEYLRDAYKEGSKDPNLSNYGERDDQVDAQLQRDYENEVAQQNAKNIQGANAYTGGVAGKVIGAGIDATTSFLAGKAGAKSILGKVGTAKTAEAATDGAKMAKASEVAGKTGMYLDDAAKVASTGSKLVKGAGVVGGVLTAAQLGAEAGKALNKYDSTHPDSPVAKVDKAVNGTVKKGVDKVKDTLSKIF